MAERQSKYQSYRSPPIVFCDESKREEWENLDPNIKNMVLCNMHVFTEKLTLDHCITTLTNVIIDLDARLKKLENHD